MAEPQIKLNLQTKPGIRSRSGCFTFGCFGVSRNKKVLFEEEEEVELEAVKYSPTAMGSSRNKSRSLSLPLFHFSSSKSSRAKTVPVVETAEKKAAANKADDHDDIDGQYQISHKSKLLIKKKSDKPKSPPVIITNQKPNSRQNSKVDQQYSLLRPPPSSNQAATETPKEKLEPNIILGNGKALDRSRTGSSLPGSPTANSKPKSKTHTSKLSHTVSLPVLDGYKRVGYSPRVKLEELRPNKDHDDHDDDEGAVQKYDPLIGISVIMMTLIIMLLWGRLCAILCTSAWFYFCPRFRTATNRNDGIAVKTTANSNGLDLNSDEYKKKVVLEGLLERNHRFT